MTRANAVDWIRRLVATMKEETSGVFHEPEYKDDVYEALNMAIKALEQEPCDDAISRKDLLSKAWFVTGDDFPMEGLEYVTKGMVENMPSVNPQPKTGHWIEYKPGHHRCSNCHKDAFVKWSPSKRDNVDVLTNCCPNCGAKMVESEDKE